MRDNENGPADDFFPILKQSVTGIYKFIFKNDKMVKQKYDNHQNRLCSINNFSEDFSYGSSINHYRRHREHEIAPVSEQGEDEMSDQYTKIPSYQEEETSEQYFDPISEFELFNENQPSDLNFDELYVDQNNTTDSEYRFPLEYDNVLKYNKEYDTTNGTCIDKTELAKKFPENPKIKDAGELIDKLTAFSKEVDLNTSVICQEQLKDPVLQQIRQLRANNTKDEKKIEFRQSKAIRSFTNNFEKLSFVGNILCIHQQTDEPDIEYLKICVSLSLFFKAFQLAHCEMSGHVGLDKTLANVKDFFWPGMYKWIENLIAKCLDCQKINKNGERDIHEAPLEKWTDTVPFPFHTVHIDHKGPLNPPSNAKHHCLVIVDSFSRFIQVYPVRSTDAVDTINALEKFILSFRIPQKLVYDKGSAFMNQDFTSYIHELGITPAPRTAYSPWTRGKVEIQNKHLGAHFRIFLEQARGKWDKLAPKFSFSQYLVPNASTGISSYEIVFGQNHRYLCHLSWDYYEIHNSPAPPNFV